MRKRFVTVVFLGIGAMAMVANAQPRETLGVVTEVRSAGGKAEIRSVGGAWHPAGPLQALREGDEVRAQGNASVVVLLGGGRGVIKVDARHSPLVIAAPSAGERRLSKAWTMVANGVRALTTGSGESPTAVISTRSAHREPEILTPRNGPVLPQTLVFEWVGSPVSRYTVRVLGPSDEVMQHKTVVSARFQYPAEAPPLQPGVRYRLQVTALNQRLYETTFELLDASRAQAVLTELREIDAELSAHVSPSTLAVARAAVLAAGGLFHDARSVVIAALSRDPDEPVLHALLGSLYTRTGLPQQAAESYSEADSLLSRDR